MAEFLTELVDRRLLSKTSLTEEEKTDWYPDAIRKHALILTPEGSAKIEEFKDEVNKLFLELTAGATGKTIRAALSPFLAGMGPVSKFLIRAIRHRAQAPVQQPRPASAPER